MESFEEFDGGRIKIEFDDSFYNKEEDVCGIWRWVKSNSANLNIKYRGNEPQEYEVEFELLAPNAIKKFKADIYLDNVLWGHVVGPCKVVIPVTLLLGQKRVVKVICSTRQTNFPDDSREFYFQFRNYSVHTEPNYVDETIRSVRKVQMEMLKKLIEICERNKLDYYAVYGTLLGIIRNQNYLPWDDDIDMCMPRRDYNELIKLDKNEHVFGEKYFLQTMYSEQDVFFGGYAKLRDNDTTGVTQYTYKKKCNNGIWIDIFPLDECKDTKQQYKRVNFIQKVICYKTDKSDIRYRRYFKLRWSIPILAKLTNRKFWIRSLDKCFQMYYNGRKTKYAILARILPMDKIDKLNKEWFEEYEIKKFGDINLRIPYMYDECLRALYGYNYMVYPDVSLRRPHCCVYYNTQISYVNGSKLYKKELKKNDV